MAAVAIATDPSLSPSKTNPQPFPLDMYPIATAFGYAVGVAAESGSIPARLKGVKFAALKHGHRSGLVGAICGVLSCTSVWAAHRMINGDWGSTVGAATSKSSNLSSLMAEPKAKSLDFSFPLVPEPLVIPYLTGISYGLGMTIGAVDIPSMKGVKNGVLKHCHQNGTRAAAVSVLYCTTQLAVYRMCKGDGFLGAAAMAEPKPKETFPSSSQRTFPMKPDIHLLPFFASNGYMACSATALFSMKTGETLNKAEWKLLRRAGYKGAAVSGLYCILFNALPYIRNKEDDWNGVLAISLASGSLLMNRGLMKMAQGMVLVGGAYCLLFAAGDRLISWSENKNEETIIGGENSSILMFETLDKIKSSEMKEAESNGDIAIE